MLKVGLTGGIASGKSHVLRRFAQAGFQTLDLDAVARDVMAPGGTAYADIARAFGDRILAADGAIDRKALGAHVFADPSARRRLEALVHPRIREAEARYLTSGAPDSVAVVDAALLVESGQHLRFARLVVVFCEPREQLRRLLARDGLTEADARARLDAQMPPEEKKRFGHFVVDNSGAPAETDAQVDAVIAALRSLAADRAPRPRVPVDRAVGRARRGAPAGTTRPRSMARPGGDRGFRWPGHGADGGASRAAARRTLVSGRHGQRRRGSPRDAGAPRRPLGRRTAPGRRALRDCRRRFDGAADPSRSGRALRRGARGAGRPSLPCHRRSIGSPERARGMDRRRDGMDGRRAAIFGPRHRARARRGDGHRSRSHRSSANTWRASSGRRRREAPRRPRARGGARRNRARRPRAAGRGLADELRRLRRVAHRAADVGRPGEHPLRGAAAGAGVGPSRAVPVPAPPRGLSLAARRLPVADRRPRVAAVRAPGPRPGDVGVPGRDLRRRLGAA